MKFSSNSNNFAGQGMFQILAQAKELERAGKNLVHLEIGDPDFDTPANIKQAAIEAIKSGDVHYTESGGLFELRQAAAKVTQRSRGFTPDMDQLLVTCGANMQIYLAFACMGDPGDEIIVPVPYFPTYKSSISSLGMILREIPLSQDNNFKVCATEIEKRITSKTRAVLINSPNNPTGAVLSAQELKDIFYLARKHDLWLLCDEVYSRQIFEGTFYSPSEIDHCKERVLIINGFSKSFAMTGWRLGVATGPAELIRRMQLLLQTIISCVPPFVQRAGIAALTQDQTEVVKMNKEYAERMELMYNGVQKIDGFSCTKPSGGIYCWINIEKTGMTCGELATKLMDKGVVVCPGTVFGCEGYIRLCCCTSKAQIEEGLRRLQTWKM
jgi:aspartate aminotransferase